MDEQKEHFDYPRAAARRALDLLRGAAAPSLIEKELLAAIAGLEVPPLPLPEPQGGESFYRLLAENVTDVIWLMDVETRRLRYVSPSVERQRGFTVDEVMARPADAALMPESLARLEARMPELVEAFRRGEKRTYVEEVEQPRRDGSTVWVEVSTTCVLDEATGRVELLGVSRDVTARRQLRLGLVQADRMASVGMLAAGIAHELNTPLSYLLVNLESLAEEGGSVDRRIADALLGAQRIRETARDLSRFSCPGDEERAPAGVQEAVALAAAMARHEMKYRARFVTDFAPDLPPVETCECRLAQVFLHLLVHAAHAIPEGRPSTHEIRVCTRAENGGVRAEVSDTGPEVPPDMRARLFEPLLDGRPGPGPGLGLAVALDIVVGFGGTLDFQTGPEGSAFQLWLPAAQRPSVVAAAPAAVAAAVVKTARARILVVDDEPCVQRALKRLLHPYAITTASSGAEARRLIEADSDAYDLVLCDVMMPDFTGIDLHRWLVRCHPALAERAVLLSGGLFSEESKRYLEQARCPRLAKPFDPDEVRRAVEGLLKRTGAPGRPRHLEEGVQP